MVKKFFTVILPITLSLNFLPINFCMADSNQQALEKDLNLYEMKSIDWKKVEETAKKIQEVDP